MTDVGQLVARGRTSDVYEYGAGAVVKVPRPSVPAHWPEREARYTAAVRELGAPAPEVLGLVEVEGRTAIVFERISGPSMWEVLCDRPQDARAIGSELAEVHHRILAAGLPLGLEGVVDRMKGKVAGVSQLSAEDRAAAGAAIGTLPRGAALLHGDLHPGNVLMSAGGPAVIDWFDAAIGHPVADVVRSSLLIRPFEPVVDRPHMPGAAAAMLSDLHDAYVEAMGGLLAAAWDEVDLWEAVVAASRLAEAAETDETPLLELWQTRGDGGLRALLTGSDQRA